MRPKNYELEDLTKNILTFGAMAISHPTRIELKSHIFEMKDGIVHCKVTSEPPTIQLLREAMVAIRQISPERKVIMVLDPTDAVALNVEQRAFVKHEFIELIDVVAVVNKNVIVKLMHTLLTKVDKMPVPMHLFKTYEEALSWAEAYRDQKGMLNNIPA